MIFVFGMLFVVFGYVIVGLLGGLFGLGVVLVILGGGLSM